MLTNSIDNYFVVTGSATKQNDTKLAVGIFNVVNIEIFISSCLSIRLNGRNFM